MGFITANLGTGKSDFIDTKETKALKDLPLSKRINWLHFYVLTIPPAMTALGMMFVPLTLNTLALTFAYICFAGLGITMGYHRLWSHQAYKAHPIVEAVLALGGAAALEGSARWWCRNHRAHHRFSDTEKDPYAVYKGFMYAHLGWMIMKQDTRKAGRVDIKDLDNNPIISFQHKYYLELVLAVGVLGPMVIAGLGWNDWLGGLFYACFMRIVIVHHSTFMVNSLAHSHGEQTYSSEHTSFDSPITAALTFGEGYHNYHHEFPNDYRNGIQWYHYDPSKWLIWSLSKVGLASDLVAYEDEVWQKAVVQEKQRRLDAEQAKINSAAKEIKWDGPADKDLPEMDWEELNHKVKDEGAKLIVYKGHVHDIADFIEKHPGGAKLMRFWNGRDATEAMTGEVYRHTKNARNILETMRVAKLQEHTEEPTQHGFFDTTLRRVVTTAELAAKKEE